MKDELLKVPSRFDESILLYEETYDNLKSKQSSYDVQLKSPVGDMEISDFDDRIDYSVDIGVDDMILVAIKSGESAYKLAVLNGESETVDDKGTVVDTPDVLAVVSVDADDIAEVMRSTAEDWKAKYIRSKQYAIGTELDNLQSPESTTESADVISISTKRMTEDFEDDESDWDTVYSTRDNISDRADSMISELESRFFTRMSDVSDILDENGFDLLESNAEWVEFSDQEPSWGDTDTYYIMKVVGDINRTFNLVYDHIEEV